MKIAALFAIALFIVACQPTTGVSNNTSNMTNNTSINDLIGEPAEVQLEAMPAGEFSVRTDRAAYFGEVEGFIAEPSADGDYPGIILIHEWWGLNQNIEETARRVASHGYRVLAVDLYNGEVAATREDAQRLRTTVNEQQALQNLGAARDFLAERGSGKIASWGFCFGGGQSANLAASSVPIDATIIYYGDLSAPLEEPESVDAPVLLIFGSEDTATTPESAQQLAAALEEQDKPVEVHIYDGVGHAFANPSSEGLAAEQTQDAWMKTLAFLEDNLG